MPLNQTNIISQQDAKRAIHSQTPNITLNLSNNVTTTNYTGPGYAVSQRTSPRNNIDDYLPVTQRTSHKNRLRGQGYQISSLEHMLDLQTSTMEPTIIGNAPVHELDKKKPGIHSTKKQEGLRQNMKQHLRMVLSNKPNVFNEELQKSLQEKFKKALAINKQQVGEDELYHKSKTVSQVNHTTHQDSILLTAGKNTVLDPGLQTPYKSPAARKAVTTLLGKKSTLNFDDSLLTALRTGKRSVNAFNFDDEDAIANTLPIQNSHFKNNQISQVSNNLPLPNDFQTLNQQFKAFDKQPLMSQRSSLPNLHTIADKNSTQEEESISPKRKARQASQEYIQDYKMSMDEKRGWAFPNAPLVVKKPEGVAMRSARTYKNMHVNDVLDYLGEFGQRAGFIADKDSTNLDPEYLNKVDNFKMNFGWKETDKEKQFIKARVMYHLDTHPGYYLERMRQMRKDEYDKLPDKTNQILGKIKVKATNEKGKWSLRQKQRSTSTPKSVRSGLISQDQTRDSLQSMGCAKKHSASSSYYKAAIQMKKKSRSQMRGIIGQDSTRLSYDEKSLNRFEVGMGSFDNQLPVLLSGTYLLHSRTEDTKKEQDGIGSLTSFGQKNQMILEDSVENVRSPVNRETQTIDNQLLIQ